jgi:hypothetical protein
MKNILFKICFLILFTFNSHAAPIEVGYLEIVVDNDSNSIKTIFEFNPLALGSANQSFYQTFGANLWHSGNTKCKWKKVETESISPIEVKMSADSFCPEMNSKLFLNLNFLNKLNNYRIIGRIKNNGIDSTFIADKNHPYIKIANANKSVFGSFVSLGIRDFVMISNKLAANQGIKQTFSFDHILFLLILIFSGRFYKQTINALMGFIIGNSISLFLGMIGFVTISSSITGPFIALSIMFIAAEGFLIHKKYNRFLMMMFFGLIHGVGFANSFSGPKLTESKLYAASMGYSLGIVLSIICFIFLFIPAIHFIKKYSNYHLQIARFSTVSVLIVGSYLFIQRIAIF